MRLGLVACLLTLSLLPTAAAQVPEVPDPADAISLLCGAVNGVEPQAHDLLPVCPRAEPAGPAPADGQAVAPPAPEAPAAPGAAQDLAGQAVDGAAGIAEDPASAPERIRGILDIIVQFVKDLLQLPVVGFREIDASVREVQDAVQAANAAVADASARGVDAVKGAIAGVADAVAALFDGTPAERHVGKLPKAPLKAPILGVSEVPLGEVRQLLPEA